MARSRVAKTPVSNAERAQVAAVPVRRGGNGGLEVLLVQTRETRRWIVPKGWPMRDRKDHRSAAREALEEAGVRGKIGKRPIGFYHYQKLLAGGVQPCKVTVYLLQVEKQLKTWPEKQERGCQWFPAREAMNLVSEPGLASMISELTLSRN